MPKRPFLIRTNILSKMCFSHGLQIFSIEFRSMNIKLPGIYHIYNRGINQQKIFFRRENYQFFLQKCHTHLKPVSDILAWSLTPTHFDFLMEVNEVGLLPVKQGCLSIPVISNAIRRLQSEYAKTINIEVRRYGNLFQQKARSNYLSTKESALTTFHYIHQIPMIDGLVNIPNEWPFSSFCEYISDKPETLCNKQKAFEFFKLNLCNIRGCLEIYPTLKISV